jgi:uncharacterized damage-inducible protein DinB
VTRRTRRFQFKIIYLNGGSAMSDPRYPIGKFSYAGPLTGEQKQQFLFEIQQTPARLRAALAGLSDQQLDTPYRDGGWTLRQVAHHVPDSHMNSYIRFKLALTEDDPTIKPYMEDLWAELPEAKHAPIEMSLALLDNLHQRWMLMLHKLDDAQWKRSFLHPALGPMSLEKSLALYAWHGRHHVAHITSLREKMGW